MLKQTFLESNQLFDPIEYFGGLKVSDLNQKVDDSRLSDMFKVMNEEQFTQKEELISYHVKSVSQALQKQKQGSNEVNSQYNLQSQIPTTSLLGYSLSNQKYQPNNNTTNSQIKQSQSSVGSLQNKNNIQIISSVNKENIDYKSANNGLNNSQVKQNAQFYKSTGDVGSPNIMKQDQFQNAHQQQLQDSQQLNQQCNQLPLQSSQQYNKQLLSSVQNSISNSNGKQNNANEIMISPQQYSKQKVIGNSQQLNGNPFFFSFQQNIGFQNTIPISQFEIKNPQPLENVKTLNNKNFQQINNFLPSNSITPKKHEFNTNEVKIKSVNIEAQPNNYHVATTKPQIKQEEEFNRMQLLQAVEQINTESQRKIGEIINISSTTNKNQTPSSRVLQNVKPDWNKLYSNQMKQQQSLQNLKHNAQQQQNISNESTLMHSIKNNSQIYNQEEQFNQFSQSQSQFNQTQSQFNQSQSQFNQSSSQFNQSSSQFNQSQSQLNQSQSQQNLQNNVAILQDQQFYQNKVNDNIEFYDQSNWQSVQQNISVQHQQSLEYGLPQQGINKFEQTSIQSAAFQNGMQSIDKLQDVLTSQQMKCGMGLISSKNIINPQSQMEEQKQMLEQFYMDKENLELTFQEDTINQIEDDLNIEQLNDGIENHLKQDGNKMFTNHYKSGLDQSPQNKTIGQSQSQRYISNKQLLINSNIAKIVSGQSILIQNQNDALSNTNQSFQNKKLREKSKSMLQGEFLQSINQKNVPGTIIQQNIPSRNNSKESNQKKNNYFVQRQMNTGITQNKLKHCNSMGIPSRQTSNTTSQSKFRDRNALQQTRQHQTSYNTSKICSSIVQNDKSQFSYDKSQLNNISNQQINNQNKSILNERNNSTNLSPSTFNNQSYQNQVQGNWDKKLLSHQKKNSVQLCSKDSFLSPKTQNKNTPRSISQYTSMDYNNCNSNFYTSHNQSINQNISQNNNTSQQSILMSPHMNQTLNSTLLKQNISPQGQYSTVVNNINQNFSMATSSYNNTHNNGSMNNSNSSTYLKRPSGKSSHYDYRSLISQANNNQKPRLISSPTQSPSNYKVKQQSQNNGQQTIRQKKLMHRLDCANTSKNTSVANSYREQQSNNNNVSNISNVTTNNPQKSSNYQNQSNILSSIALGCGKYGNICDNIDKDLKYNIAVEAKKQLYKVDSKYEDTLNHFVNMQIKNQNQSLSQSNNSNCASINQHMSSQSISYSSSNMNSQNMPKTQTNNQNYQKQKQNSNSIIYQ